MASQDAYCSGAISGSFFFAHPQSQDLDEALEGFEKKKKDEWTAEEKRRDHKVMSLI